MWMCRCSARGFFGSAASAVLISSSALLAVSLSSLPSWSGLPSIRVMSHWVKQQRAWKANHTELVVECLSQARGISVCPLRFSLTRGISVCPLRFSLTTLLGLA